MTIELHVTDTELAQLQLLVLQELESSRVELHHTTARPYREYVKQRMDNEISLLKKMEAAHPSTPSPQTA